MMSFSISDVGDPTLYIFLKWTTKPHVWEKEDLDEGLGGMYKRHSRAFQTGNITVLFAEFYQIEKGRITYV